MWKIGDIEIKNKIVLAPMAGVSNPSFIRICEEMGAGYAITELISSEAIVRNNKKTFEMLNGIEKINIPIAVQIFGSNPSVMRDAAFILVHNYGVKIIDINMGGPVPKVAIHAKAGSYLMKEPNLVYDIVKEVSKSGAIVTAKIRSGWDKNSINAVSIAKICESAGCSCITVHARTRSEGYSGCADWNIIKNVKEAVSIPVIGNGDVKSEIDAKRMLLETKCDDLMIGRALLGNPFLIERCILYLEGKNMNDYSYKSKLDVCLKHLKYLSEIKTEKEVVLEMRGNIAWYIKGMPNSANIKNKIFKSSKISDIVNIVEEYKNELEEI